MPRLESAAIRWETTGNRTAFGTGANRVTSECSPTIIPYTVGNPDKEEDMFTDRRIALNAFVAAGAVLALVACGQQSEQATTPAPQMDVGTTIASSANVEDAIAFWEALAAGDREAALGLVDPAGLKNPPFGRAFTLEGQFDWYEAVGWEWDARRVWTGQNRNGRMHGDRAERLVRCSRSGSGNRYVRGSVRYGRHHLRHREARIVLQPMASARVRDLLRLGRRQSSSRRRVMFEFSVDVNPEILELYAVNTRRFVDAHEGR